VGNIQVDLSGRDYSGKLTLVLRSDFLESNDSSSLFVDNGTKAGLALDDNVWDTHLAAKGRQEDDELDRVNVMRDHDQRSFLGFDKGNDVVQPILDEKRLLSLLQNELVSRVEDTQRSLRTSLLFPSATAAASASRRVFFSTLDSGRYLLSSLNN
jgi:hypothetical protein